MRDSEIEFSPFTAREPQQRVKWKESGNFRARRRGGQQTVRAGGMWLKIGFCMTVLAAAVLFQKFVLEDAAQGQSVIEASSDSQQADESGEDDVLGRLRFVEEGGVKSVFATSQRWRMPAEHTAATLQDDDHLLVLSAGVGETVSVPAAGEVRAIAYDETLGHYVRIHHGNDLESIYYNISDISVEEGQPLLAQDTLGKVGDGGKLYVRVTVAGVPQLPAAYLNVSP